MQIIDGKATAEAIKAEIAEEVRQIVSNGEEEPHTSLQFSLVMTEVQKRT